MRMIMFNPRFKYTFCLQEATEAINAPHEPKAILATGQAIQQIANHKDIVVIGETLVREVHQYICEMWLKSAGSYRKVPVEINHQIKDFYDVPMKMAAIHPYRVYTIEHLQEWYRLFQEIHPFEDGNGRVGGAVIAGMSFANWGYYLIPDGI